MIRYGAFIIALLAITASSGQIPDSSDLIFDDTKIQKYDLYFYTEKWADTLEYYKANNEVYIPARLKWRGPNGDSMTLDSIGVRYKGNSSYNFAGANPKKPYKFCFNKYIKTQTFFNLEIMNLGNLVYDPSCMREKISYDLARKYMHASRASYAVISVQGAEIGLFLQVEEIDQGFLKRHFQDYQSNLYKSNDNGASLSYKGTKAKDYASEYDLKTNKGPNDWSGLILMLDKLNNTSDSNFIKVAGNVLDLDMCVRYTAFNMVTSNFDSYTGSSRNIYLYDDHVSKQFKLIPWDFNLGLGNYANSWDVITVDAFNIPNLDIRPLSKRILSNDSLKQAYGRYLSYMMLNEMSHDAMAAMAQRIKPIIDSAVKNDPNAFYTYDQFLANIENDITVKEGPTSYMVPGIKSFPTARAAQLKTQIARENIPVLEPWVQSRPQSAALRCRFMPGGKSISVQYNVTKGTGRIVIRMHNAKGELVRFVAHEVKAAGPITANLDTRLLPSGFYTVSVTANATRASAGIMLIKFE
jgi:spore coat protein CotH/ribosomal protein S19E (S16A)